MQKRETVDKKGKKRIIEVPSGEFAYSETPIVTTFSISADKQELLSMGSRKENVLRM
jgi:hypothetical protein